MDQGFVQTDAQWGHEFYLSDVGIIRVRDRGGQIKGFCEGLLTLPNLYSQEAHRWRTSLPGQLYATPAFW